MVNEVTKRGDPPIFEYIGPRDDEGNMQPVAVRVTVYVFGRGRPLFIISGT
jgi:hypothetical protein